MKQEHYIVNVKAKKHNQKVILEDGSIGIVLNMEDAIKILLQDVQKLKAALQ